MFNLSDIITTIITFKGQICSVKLNLFAGFNTFVWEKFSVKCYISFFFNIILFSLTRKKVKKRKQKKDSEMSDEDEQKLKSKKLKQDDVEPSKKSKTGNGVGNGKSIDITMVDLEEELNLEELMKQKVSTLFGC